MSSANTPLTIELEDIATLFASEFVKSSKAYLAHPMNFKNIPFLKMNYSRRRKIVEKVLDKLEKDFKNENRSNK